MRACRVDLLFFLPFIYFVSISCYTRVSFGSQCIDDVTLFVLSALRAAYSIHVASVLTSPQTGLCVDDEPQCLVLPSSGSGCRVIDCCCGVVPRAGAGQGREDNVLTFQTRLRRSAHCAAPTAGLDRHTGCAENAMSFTTGHTRVFQQQTFEARWTIRRQVNVPACSRSKKNTPISCCCTYPWNGTAIFPRLRFSFRVLM